MAWFKITYTDPETQERVVVEEEYHDTPTVTAAEWAEDAAYSYANKGPYTVDLMKRKQ